MFAKQFTYDIPINQVAMIEAYLRANNMFVDYSEVGLYVSSGLLFLEKSLLCFSRYLSLFFQHASLNKKECTHLICI